MPILHSIKKKQDIEKRVMNLRDKLPFQYLRAICVFCPKINKSKVYDLMNGKTYNEKLLKQIEQIID